MAGGASRGPRSAGAIRAAAAAGGVSARAAARPRRRAAVGSRTGGPRRPAGTARAVLRRGPAPLAWSGGARGGRRGTAGASIVRRAARPARRRPRTAPRTPSAPARVQLSGPCAAGGCSPRSRRWPCARRPPGGRRARGQVVAQRLAGPLRLLPGHQVGGEQLVHQRRQLHRRQRHAGGARERLPARPETPAWSRTARRLLAPAPAARWPPARAGRARAPRASSAAARCRWRSGSGSPDPCPPRTGRAGRQLVEDRAQREHVAAPIDAAARGTARATCRRTSPSACPLACAFAGRPTWRCRSPTP